MTRLVPYQETKVHWTDRSRGAFEIRTPWIAVTAAVDEKAVPAVQEAMDAVNNGPKSPRERLVSSYLLKQFEEYPLAFSEPRRLEEYSVIAELVQGQSNVPAEGLRDFAPRWDQQEILDASRIEGTSRHDAVTAVALIRRLRLKEMSANQGVQEQLKELRTVKTTDPKRFVETMRGVLAHSLYVTRNAVSCLSAGLGRHGPADELLRQFIKSETGHDLLVAKSLKALGCENPDGLPLRPEVRDLMELLRQAAATSMLALATLLEGFESLAYDKEPQNLWRMLEDIPGHPRAATGVQEHQRINDSQGHANACLELAATLPPVTAEDVTFALRASEASERLRHSLFANIYKSIGRL